VKQPSLNTRDPFNCEKPRRIEDITKFRLFRFRKGLFQSLECFQISFGHPIFWRSLTRRPFLIYILTHFLPISAFCRLVFLWTLISSSFAQHNFLCLPDWNITFFEANTDESCVREYWKTDKDWFLSSFWYKVVGKKLLFLLPFLDQRRWWPTWWDCSWFLRLSLSLRQRKTASFPVWFSWSLIGVW